MKRMYRGDAVVVSTQLLLRVANLLGRRIILGELVLGQPGEWLPSTTVYANATFTIAAFNAAQSESFWELLPPGRSEVLLFGAEAHSSIVQTGLALLKAGKSVSIVADAVAAHNEFEKRIALGRLVRAGAEIVSVEMVIYEWLSRCAEDDQTGILQLLENFRRYSVVAGDQLEKGKSVSDIDSVGKKLRRCRMARGLTQTQVAQRCRCCASQLSKIENGKALPTLAFLKLLSKVLEIDIRLLMTKIDHEAQP